MAGKWGGEKEVLSANMRYFGFPFQWGDGLVYSRFPLFCGQTQLLYGETVNVPSGTILLDFPLARQARQS